MNLRTHKIIVIIALALVLCTGATLLAQALFQAFSDDVSGTVNVTPPAVDGSAYYVVVNNEQDLIEATKAITYNDPASNARADANVGRCIVLLGADITLNNDLTVTRDCHIDLGGKSLDLNGYAINVFHTYSGAFLIANGNLVSTKTEGKPATQVKGTVNVNTPHAAVLVDATYSADQITLNTTALSDEMVCMSALSMVCAHLSNSLGDHGVYGLLNEITADGCKLPVMSAFGCSHANGCAFITSDADLPYWFFGYQDIQITYTSSDAAVMNNYGKVTGTGVTTLTAKVTYNGVTKEAPFTVHVLGSDSDYAKAAIAILQHDLSSYKKGDNYNFDTPVALPHTMVVGNQVVNMTYAASGSSAHVSTPDGAQYTLYTTTSETAVDLTITATSGTSSATGTIPTTGHASDVEETEYTKANRIIKQLFGGGITIYKDEDDQGAAYYTSQSLAYDVNDYPDNYDFTGIVFELIGDNHASYDITGTNPNQTLVVTGTPEQYVYMDTVYLRATVTINAIPIVINVPVNIVDKTVAAEGGTVAQFLPYYHYFNQLFSTTTGNYTYRDFTFPTGYPNSQVQIEFYLVDPDDYTFSALATDYLTVSKVNGEWSFNIDPEKIGRTDQELILGYRYTLDGSKWENFDAGKADGKFTYLTIPGVLNTTEDVVDEALYGMLFKIYHPEALLDEDTDTWDYTYKTDYILTSRLNRVVDQTQLNFSSTGVTTVKNYKGIEFLSGATGINLDGALTRGTTTNFTTMTTYLTQMTNLEYLNLANNNIQDSEGGFNFGATTDVIAPLTVLTKMNEIHLENNVIHDFTSLIDFPELKTAYVYGNVPTFNGFGIGFIDNMIADVLQQVYGSVGATNTATFAALHATGTTIYNKTNGDDPVAFTPEAETTNMYLAFSNIEYQDKLYEGVPIESVWATMSTDPQAYGIAKKMPTNYATYKNGAQSSGTFENKISFEKISDTEFALVYTDYIIAKPSDDSDNLWGYIFGTNQELAFEYSVKFRFKVTRVDANGNPIVKTPTT
ncbi:MAG: leucine-rich repeat domain-containing protein [Ruminococcaceae bacterium]|nr:leucine-rich repeat domain-containing protein [Oscillospiraceae bacterium]